MEALQATDPDGNGNPDTLAQTITVDGFGDPYNHGLRAFAATDQGLCLGTANPFYGTQVWIKRKDS